MSDFLFVSKQSKKGILSRCLSEIYPGEKNGNNEFHGAWGSLAVSLSRYNGFEPLITDDHICVVLGGPVLGFRDNRFLSEKNSQAGTRAIYERWFSDNINWSEDLSGPFIVLIINQKTHEALCFTDLMMFIPVYQYQDEHGVALGSHIDALAKACQQESQFDETSLVDFILHEVITYPYTAYRNIRQGYPAAVHRYHAETHTNTLQAQLPVPYWLPQENYPHKNLNEAAGVLKKGVSSYISRVTESMEHVAQFTSGGEDSRAISGMIPEGLRRDAFIFLDHMNREGKVAKKVAAAYGASFKPEFRRPEHYISILPPASVLIGSGHQYVHAHSLTFDKKCHLGDYTAVFGGYLADSLLKAQYVRKPQAVNRFGFLPQVCLDDETRSETVVNSLFSDRTLEALTQRRREHLKRVEALRPASAHEWFTLWPATMRITMPNLYSNRRLFASFEPFMSKEAVKVAASVPTGWKLNRRLFNKAFCPFLTKTRWLAHADGRLPYYPWYVNSPIQFFVWFYRHVERRLGMQEKGHQGPWCDWPTVMKTPEWQEAVDKATSQAEGLPEIQKAIDNGAFSEGGLKTFQKLGLLQSVYLFDNMKNK